MSWIKLALIVLVCLIVVSSIPISNAATNKLVPFTSRVCSTTTSQPGFAQDNGVEQNCFSPSSMYWSTPGGNFSLGFPTIAGLSLPVTAKKNSTIIDYTLSANILLHAVTMDVIFRNVTGRPFDRQIIITGSIMGLVGTLPMGFLLNAQGQQEQVQNCDSSSTPIPCTQECFGTECLDWSDAIQFGSAYNNLTRILVMNVGSTFTIDPFAVDGNGHTTCTGTLSTCTVTITTVNGNDLFYLTIGINDATQTISSVASTHLTWIARANEPGTGEKIWTYYATDTSALTAEAILVTRSAMTGGWGLFVFAVSNAELTFPFDSNAAVPCKNAGTGGTESCSVTWNSANVMLVGTFLTSGGGTYTAGALFTFIGGPTGGPAVQSEESIFASAVGPTTATIAATYSLSAKTWAMIGDVVRNKVQSDTFALSISLLPSFVQNPDHDLDVSLSLSPGFSQSVTPKTFAASLSLSAAFHQAVAITRALSIMLSPTFSSGHMFTMLANAAIQLQINFCVTPPFGCGAVTVISGNTINFDWLILLPLIVLLLVVVVKKKRF